MRVILALLLLAISVNAVGAAIEPGFNRSALPRNDDGSQGPVPIGFDVNLFGTTFSELYVNNNGNVTFDGSLSSFTPFSLLATQVLIVAPFFADVDTGVAGDVVSYGPGSFANRPAFGVNWVNVDYFSSSAAHTRRNSFQLILVQRSERAVGDFDIVFNYDQIQWEAGQASGSDANGLGGASARAGFAIGRGAPGSSFELQGSAIPGSFIDNGPNSLIRGSRGSTVAGRYVFEVRGGDRATQVTTLTPFANAPSTGARSDSSGRFVLFQSRASNLAGGDTNAASDIYRIDTRTGEIRRASLDNAGAQISGDAIEPAISGDGGLVLFVAQEAGVGKVLGESGKQAETRRKGGGWGIFLRNLINNTTQRVGAAAGSGAGTLPQVSAASRAVVFTRENTSAAEGTVGQANVYVAPLLRQNGQPIAGPARCVSCKSIAANGSDSSTNSNGTSGKPVISADGNWVAWETRAKNALSATPAPCPATATEVMLRNLATGVAHRVSTPVNSAACGTALAGGSAPSLDFNATRLAFGTDVGLETGDGNNLGDIYVYDVSDASVVRVSEGAGNASGNGASGEANLAGNGQHLSFTSSATNLDTSSADSNGRSDVHVVALGSGSIRRLSQAAGGVQVDGDSVKPSLNFDGSVVAFESNAGNLAPGAVAGQSSVFQRANPLAVPSNVLKSATWWNPSESGWGLFTIDQGNIVAPGWFTYDTDGEPTWFLVPGATEQPDGSYRGNLLRFTGVRFDQIAGSAATGSSQIGEANFRFVGDSFLEFQYRIGSTTQAKSLSKFLFGPRDLVCRPSPTASRATATNFTDLWWAGEAGSDGWGVHISHVDDALFATWYTYDTDGEAIFMIAATERQADGSYAGPLLRQRNGTPFLQIDGQPASPGANVVGSATLRFSNGQAASFAYTVGSVSQSKAITRLQFGSVPGVCATAAPATTAKRTPVRFLEAAPSPLKQGY